MSNDPFSAPPDDALRQRMERLAQRRTATNGPPPPPASPGTAAPKGRARTKRHHPAKAARIGALALSCVTSGGLTYLFANVNASQAATQALAELPAPIPVTTQPVAASSTAQQTFPTYPAPDTTAATAASTTAAAAATPQAFNGQLVNTRFGPVQVQAQFVNGTLSEVAVIHSPDGDNKSVRINARALPTLRTEALTAHSAQIDSVSGATYTSNGYTQSLQSALDQARAAGVLIS